MATMITARRAFLSKLLERFIATPSHRPVAAAAVRSFNIGALREYDDHEDSDVEDLHKSADSTDHRRADARPIFRDVFQLFNPTRNLSPILNPMDRMLDSPLYSKAGPRATGGLRRAWDAREDNDALYLRVDMPGLGKEHVKVWAEQNTLLIKGQGEERIFWGPYPENALAGSGEEVSAGEESTGRKYSSRIDLPPDSYRMDQIRAEMRNGVLRVMVPKMKEERKDVFRVNVE